MPECLSATACGQAAHTVTWSRLCCCCLQVIELPLKHPELFESLGIAQPKVGAHTERVHHAVLFLLLSHQAMSLPAAVCVLQLQPQLQPASQPHAASGAVTPPYGGQLSLPSIVSRSRRCCYGSCVLLLPSIAAPAAAVGGSRLRPAVCVCAPRVCCYTGPPARARRCWLVLWLTTRTAPLSV